MSRYWPEEKKLTARDVEFYVQGMYDLAVRLGCDSGRKVYDPLTIEGNIAHSYVMDLRDGGRHHPFDTLEQLADDALADIASWVREEIKDEAPHSPLNVRIGTLELIFRAHEGT